MQHFRPFLLEFLDTTKRATSGGGHLPPGDHNDDGGEPDYHPHYSRLLRKHGWKNVNHDREGNRSMWQHEHFGGTQDEHTMPKEGHIVHKIILNHHQPNTWHHTVDEANVDQIGSAHAGRHPNELETHLKHLHKRKPEEMHPYHNHMRNALNAANDAGTDLNKLDKETAKHMDRAHNFLYGDKN